MNEKKVRLILCLVGISLPSGLGYAAPSSGAHFVVNKQGATNVVVTPSRELAAPLNCAAHFSPDDHLQQRLIDLIKAERTKISVAVFVITDQEIAQALVDAHNRGVAVEVVVDPSCLQNKHHQVTFLVDHGVPIFMYAPSSAHKGAIMHHKFALFDESGSGEPVVWTGSFNFTRAASRHNEENALILRGGNLAQQFARRFATMKERSNQVIANQKQTAGKFGHEKKMGHIENKSASSLRPLLSPTHMLEPFNAKSKRRISRKIARQSRVKKPSALNQREMVC